MFPPTLPTRLTCSIFLGLLNRCCLFHLHCVVPIQLRHLFSFSWRLLVRFLVLTLLIVSHLLQEYNKMPPSSRVGPPLFFTHTQKKIRTPPTFVPTHSIPYNYLHSRVFSCTQLHTMYVMQTFLSSNFVLLQLKIQCCLHDKLSRTFGKHFCAWWLLSSLRPNSCVM